MKQKKKTKKGFTLVELLIGMFLFVVLVASVSQIFADLFKVNHKVRTIHTNTEDVQYAFNLMSKTLRTSNFIESVSDPGVSGSSTLIRAYDYYNSECLEYQFDSDKLKLKAESIGAGDCEAHVFTSGSQDLVDGDVGGKFDFKYSDSANPESSVVLITMIAKVCPDGQGTSCTNVSEDMAVVQTSVSVRNQ